LPDFAVEIVHRFLRRPFSVDADIGIERLSGVFEQQLLPGANLVRCAESDTVACSRTTSGAIFAFSAASILRLVFFVMVSSVYQTERSFSNLPNGPKIRVHLSLPHTDQG
jgi:hypothetical protein